MNYTREMRRKQMLEHLARRVLVLDGAMGTMIQARNLTAKDFGGADLEGCNENLVLTRPDVILDIHKNYLAAGADIVETNTFGATPLVLAEYGLQDKAHEINVAAARIARQAANAFSSDARPRFVAGSIGPTTKALSVTGGTTFDELVENFRIQARGLIEGEADYLLLETCQDTRNVKAGLVGCHLACKELGVEVPIAVSGTIEPMGTMLAGQSAEALVASLAHEDLLYVGLNCATGPEFMTDHVRSIAGLTRSRVAVVPNAGLPDENGSYRETPEMLSAVIARFGAAGWVNLIGGCCGTTPAHIQELRRVADAMRPREPKTAPRSFLSGIEYLEVTDEMRPLLVGERTNVIGSKKFKEMIIAEKFEEAAEIARAQVKGGAQIVDVCLANPDRNELADMERFLSFVTKMVKVPLMIDSTDEKVLEASLKWCQGKAIINSINLEDGEERFEKVVPLAKRYGAALVVGTIDDDPKQGMGVTRQRKLEIARRAYSLLTRKYGIEPEDIWWDVLVFPCATGDEQYVGSAVETIEGIRLVKKEFPRTKSTLGISNVSFGLPPAGREVLNSVFLYHCVQAGLDSAIVNSEKLERYATIPEEERVLAEDLLFNRTEKGDVVARFAAHFRDAKSKTKSSVADLPLDERLPRYIVEGTKEGLAADLQKKLDEGVKPLDVINGPLMKGMDEVGKLFNENKLIVAEVLQSAEAMKAAVSYLEPFMEKSESSTRGTVLLATVKGDVHDIGKNLVEIILANNGFKVVNLGIKVPPEQLLAAIREHKPDIVGLSGLLVKSAQQMVITAADLTTAGVKLPMMVGGAALSRNFVDKKIAPAYGGFVCYASDAMNGLDLAKKIVDEQGFAELQRVTAERRAEAGGEEGAKAAAAPAPTTRSKEVEPLPLVPDVPYWDRKIDRTIPIDIPWRYVNPRMLFGRHLGLRGNVLRQLEENDIAALRKTDAGRKALDLKESVDAMKQEIREKKLLQPRAVWQFLAAESEGNKLHVLSPDRRTKRATFEFPRQARENGLCLSDYVNPKGTGAADHLAAFVVTAGTGVREQAERWKNEGAYLKSHLLQALALETAEGYAEYLHAQIRGLWGFADDPDVKMLSLFQARYRGKRYSFGYPACPRLDDQAILWELLKPQEIGVQLTDGFMMDPEASVSALAFHHPEASYFSVGASAIDQAAEELEQVVPRVQRSA